VYSSWRVCEAQVNGFSHNNYIGYETREEAEEELRR
jgi:viroplasmin and RNaseH domain-containing protein